MKTFNKIASHLKFIITIYKKQKVNLASIQKSINLNF